MLKVQNRYWFNIEFTGLHSNFLLCKLQFYTVKFTVLAVNAFIVFLYFLPNYSGKIYGKIYGKKNASCDCQNFTRKQYSSNVLGFTVLT